MLDQRALELEGADPVARGHEHVVGAADVGDATLGVARADVAGVSATRAAPVALVRIQRTRPRARRSARSGPDSSSVAGITTTPSLIAAGMVSHSGTSLPSISSIRSPGFAPRPERKFATWVERRDSSA
jgi:hypothetical protein